MVALTLIAYLPAVHAGFIWDDDQHLTENPCIVGPLGFLDIWTSSQAFYYPLVLSSFWLVHKFAGLNPLPYHLLNLMMHAASGVVLWRVLAQFRVRAAWLGAALWALHPVMVQSVAWITELKNTQSGFLYLLAILFFLKCQAPNAASKWQRWGLACSLLFFIMSITSKAATVMLPVVLALCFWWKNGRLRWRDLAMLTPFFLISAAGSVWTIWEQKFHSGAIGGQWTQTWPERLVISGKDLWFYFSKIVWPAHLSFFYPRWKIDATKASAFLPLLAAIVAFSLLWWKRRGQLRPVFVTFVYFAALLFPVLGFFNVYFFRYSFVSDHFQYLAAMGPLALAAGLFDKGLTIIGKIGSWVRPAAVTVLLVVFGTLTYQQTTSYADAKTLYQMVIEQNPECWLAYSNLGGLALQNKNINEAIDDFDKAIAINPDSVEAQYSLGNAYLEKGDVNRAIAPYKAALRIRPDHVQAHSNLAICLSATGNLDAAIAHFKEALRLDPNRAETHYNFGYLLLQMGHREEALPQFEKAVQLKGDYTQAKEQLRLLTSPPR